MKSRNTYPLSCFGNKYKEQKKIIEIIKPYITDKTIFIDAMCGSCSISFNLSLLQPDIKYIINDLDHHRIEFYKNMRDETKRNELYELEKEIKEKGKEFYNLIVKTDKTSYNSYVIGKRIKAQIEGLFPINREIKLKEITPDWIDFYNKVEMNNKDYKEIIEEYKDNKDAIIYLDPPYLNSWNTQYSAYSDKSIITDDKIFIKDNTQIYIDILEILKNSKCSIFISINSNAITKYLYKEYIIDEYNVKYEGTIKNNKEIKEVKNQTKKNEQILLLANKK